MWHSGTKFPNKPDKEQFVSKCYNEQQEKSVYFAGINSYMIASESLTAFNAFLIIAALKSAPTVHVLYPLIRIVKVLYNEAFAAFAPNQISFTSKFIVGKYKQDITPQRPKILNELEKNIFWHNFLHLGAILGGQRLATICMLLQKRRKFRMFTLSSSERLT
jgi:hypothetical protein